MGLNLFFWSNLFCFILNYSFNMKQNILLIIEINLVLWIQLQIWKYMYFENAWSLVFNFIWCIKLVNFLERGTQCILTYFNFKYWSDLGFIWLFWKLFSFFKLQWWTFSTNVPIQYTVNVWIPNIFRLFPFVWYQITSNIQKCLLLRSLICKFYRVLLFSINTLKILHILFNYE